MKKFRLVWIAFLMIFATTIPALAVEENKDRLNEYELYNELKVATNDELKQIGFNELEIIDIRETSLEEKLLERKSYGDDKLLAIGYTPEEINVLRAYDGSEITPDSAVYAILAECTADLRCTAASSRSMTLCYEWEWDRMPLTTAVDSAAIRWKAVKSSGSEIDVIPSNTYCVAHFYSDLDGTKKSEETYYSSGSNFVNNSIDDCVQFKFSIAGSGASSWWLKKGWLYTTIVVDSTVTESMVYVKAHGKYAHTVFFVTPSISEKGEFSFSYTNTATELAPQTYKFNATTGARTALPEE